MRKSAADNHRAGAHSFYIVSFFMQPHPDFNVVLLHDEMVNKAGELVTTSLTLIDVHDIARSSRTYGVRNTFIAHPSPTIRKLAHTLYQHWDEGYGSTYNPNRKEAMEVINVVADLDEAIAKIDLESKALPTLIATSAHQGGDRISFKHLRNRLQDDASPHLLMLGTGWGMSAPLLKRADLYLEPIEGPVPYNHLSVRSACAILLDRLLGKHGC